MAVQLFFAIIIGVNKLAGKSVGRENSFEAFEIPFATALGNL